MAGSKVTDKMIHIAIIGSRSLGFEEIELVMYHVLKTRKTAQSDITILTGDSKGVDAAVKIFSDTYGIPCRVYKAKPFFARTYNVRAYHARNDCIISDSDILIAVWDGKSKGTSSVIAKAKRLGKPILVYLFQPQHAKRTSKGGSQDRSVRQQSLKYDDYH